MNALSNRQMATMLAALRLWQLQRDRDIPGGLMTIATDGNTLERLDNDEIDVLCERLNGGE